jgi:hypothetical protein
LIVSVVFLSGLQLLFLGILGEYVGRIYEEVKGRPLFVVDRVLGDATSFSPGEPTQKRWVMPLPGAG